MILSFFRRRPLVPLAAACCLVLIAVVQGGGFGSGGRSSTPSAQSPPYYGSGAGSADGNYGESYVSGGAMAESQKTANGAEIAAEMPSPSAPDMGYDASDGAGSDQADRGPNTSAAGAADTGQTGATGATEQKIIRLGNLSLEVDQHDAAVAAIKGITASLGGYITSESSYLIDSLRERKAGNIQVKVPYGRYDQLLERIGELGKITESSVNAEDVTSQYIDLTARIQVYETKQERLLSLLEQSGGLADILSVERELADTNAELEALKGQLRYLLSRTDYSTLDISLREKSPEAAEIRLTGFSGFLQKVKEAFFLGINGFLAGLAGLLVWLAGHVTGVVIALAVFWIVWVKLLGRRWRNRRTRRD